MIVKFNDFEIKLEAKCGSLAEDYNEIDTLYFLNWIAMMAHDAAEANAVAGYKITADSLEEGSQQLYQQLKELGCCDRLEEEEC